MRYGILGTTQANHDDGTAVPLAGTRLRALLAALALHAGRVRTTEGLIDEVWGEDPPADAAGALQALVGRLRRVLGHEAIGSVDGGYRLTARPDAVDAYRFERLVDEGGRALADGNPGKAAEALDDALALWRGPALADLPDRATAAPRYEALRLNAQRLRLTAEVALGRAEQALPELAELTAEHPLNEPLRALRIRALRDAGRTADALGAYEEVRRTLAEELGTDPGAELQALYAELLEAPAALAPAPAPAPAPRPTGNARARLTSFVGRETDLTALRSDLDTARLVTLTGPGGTGKTRLSQEAGDLVADRWPDGVWFAELAPVEDPAGVPVAVVNALGLRETLLHGGSAAEAAMVVEAKKKSPALQLADYCSGRRLLLVLDNCEHVIDAAAALAERLLADCPGVAVLATSREPLGVPGELVRPLDPLPQPPALRLLADRGAAARAGFTPDEDPEACAELCRRLDGLPLAIELAAARLRSLTPRQLADRLDDRFRILTGGSRTVLPRQQTLRAVVDWSWDLLEPDERILLRRLAVFAGGWTLEAVEEVCSGDGADGIDGGIEAVDIAVLLASLVDKSLVLADLTDDGARYRMLETISEYAAERLAASGERAGTERRHITHFREYARTTDPLLRGPDQLLWLDRLEREHDNLRAALRRAVEAGDEQEALVITLACSWFWEMRNYVTELRFWPEKVAALSDEDPFDPNLVPVPLDHGPLDRPLPMPAGQLREARRWIWLAGYLGYEGDLERWSDPDAVRIGQAFVAAYPPGLPQSSVKPGLMRPFACFLSGDFGQLRELADETVESCRTHGRIWELAFILQLRAKVMNDISDTIEVSMNDIRESRALFEQVGDNWGVAECLAAEAETTSGLGDWVRAAECCREAIGLARRLGSHQQVPILTIRLGDALVNSGETAEGERLLRAGIADAERFGVSGHGAALYGRVLLSGLLGYRGDVAEAHTLMDEFLDALPAGVPPFISGLLLGMKGWLMGIEGDPVGGLRTLGEGIDRLHGHPLTSVIAPRMGLLLIPIAIVNLALLPDPGTALLHSAALLNGAHDHLRAVAIAPYHKAAVAKAAVSLREGLGAAAYDAAYAEGAGLTIEQAVTLMREMC
ncbi:BTAD domain-containing putative transcriptional regulator [Streptomyces sp. NBC_01262]|uniref:BTAD domain-containing putative transcriptional regulator n=1 Tax=Streptomyces sp. NBC_01262 TaxID=2903803 RepID=UPI002E2ED47A|nr:BTAD domain-containing putative transcriptional regulator [Streptomyces sp. NBC_01262]